VWGRNFTGDYEITGSFPLQYLRIRKNPEPTGSVLSNRGERLSYVTSDVDNQSRGSVGQPYDVGADEFTGLPYVNDVEIDSRLTSIDLSQWCITSEFCRCRICYGRRSDL
jgi:hypothetical protein